MSGGDIGWTRWLSSPRVAGSMKHQSRPRCLPLFSPLRPTNRRVEEWAEFIQTTAQATTGVLAFISWWRGFAGAASRGYSMLSLAVRSAMQARAGAEVAQVVLLGPRKPRADAEVAQVVLSGPRTPRAAAEPAQVVVRRHSEGRSTPSSYPFGLALCHRQVSAHMSSIVFVARQPSSASARDGVGPVGRAGPRRGGRRRRTGRVVPDGPLEGVEQLEHRGARARCRGSSAHGSPAGAPSA